MDFNVDIERINTAIQAARDGFRWVVLRKDRSFAFATSRDLLLAKGEYFLDIQIFISDLEHELMLHTQVILQPDGTLTRASDGLFIEKINADISLFNLPIDRPFHAYDIPLGFSVYVRDIYPELL